MPRSTPARRLTPTFAALPALAVAVDEPPAAAPAGEAKVIQFIPTPSIPTPVFRVGNYEVGEGYCPCLHGHPDIRY